MKKLGKILAAVTLLMGIGAAHFVQDAKAEPTCPGTGTQCATATDGTIYWKGSDY